ncbi:metalloendopeptidase [Coemansia thaxteri]|uniref:Metalloendopeptidase n=1 Tax=Coemansia thaxteri TaxID=2663907 RepID=A0A9W8BGY3_9FUNG|nr:metalloendopeptidase [Coemansia thaxteri]
MPMTHTLAKGTVLDFSLSSDDIAQRASALVARGQQIQDDVAAQTELTFDSVIAPLGARQNEQDADYSLITFLQHVSTNRAVRDASSAAEEKLQAFEIESMMREDVYRVVRAVFDNADEMAKLGAEDRRLVEKIEQAFRRSGLALDREARGRLGKIKTRLSELTIAFSRNVNEGDGRIVLTRAELDGLPDDFFESRKTEDVDGVEGFVVTTKYPDLVPVLKLAKREDTRERLFVVESQRCPENIPLLQEAISLRLEAARLLGYKTHAQFVLEESMAKTPRAVLDFEHDLRHRLSALGDREMAELEAMKRGDCEAAGRPYPGLFAWDYRYYSNQAKERKHNISDEEVKQYFPVKEVTRGILDIYQKMLSLRFVRVDSPPVWHADVEMYEVWEAVGDAFVGHFYLDLYPRENKYNHAAVWPIRAGFDRPDGSREFPVAAMVANFPKPTLSAPALLTHEDATTLLHELGHVFHSICSLTKWARFHGTNTERDFVEAPSQMLENWSWEPSVLRRFAVHHQTGSPIPEALVKRLVNAKNEGAGLANLRQIFFGMFDMAIHNSAEDDVDIKQAYDQLYEDICRFSLGPHKTWVAATFGHMMGGYDAGYYGYLWSEVFSADMYDTRFRNDGVDNPQTGLDYRNEILRPGYSRDAMDSLEIFLGRKPNNRAFLKSIGLDATAD